MPSSAAGPRNSDRPGPHLWPLRQIPGASRPCCDPTPPANADPSSHLERCCVQLLDRQLVNRLVMRTAIAKQVQFPQRIVNLTMALSRESTMQAWLPERAGVVLRNEEPPEAEAQLGDYSAGSFRTNARPRASCSLPRTANVIQMLGCQHLARVEVPPRLSERRDRPSCQPLMHGVPDQNFDVTDGLPKSGRHAGVPLVELHRAVVVGCGAPIRRKSSG